jgi:hypothetical protein
MRRIGVILPFVCRCGLRVNSAKNLLLERRALRVVASF